MNDNQNALAALTHGNIETNAKFAEYKSTNTEWKVRAIVA